MPLFILFAIFALWVLYRIRQSTRLEQQRRDNFWQEERDADNVRRQDISNLDYITIDYDALPFQENATEPVKSYQNTLLSLKDATILNLTGYTNTELKKMYGAPNLPSLMEYDSNYTTLVSALARWGKYCFEQNQITAAKAIFEYGILLKTDVSFNYTLLAEIYQNEGNADKIRYLTKQAEQIRSLTKDGILKQLHAILDDMEYDF